MKIPKIFCCPECKSSELVVADCVESGYALSASEAIICSNCDRIYPYSNGVWVLWSDEVKSLYEGHASEGSIATEAKRANIEIYEEASESYEVQMHETHVDVVRLLREESIRGMGCEVSSGAVTVDVGCAIGIGLDQGTSIFDTVVGVDISYRNLIEVGRRGFVPVLADAEKLPFRDGSIELISCFAALHHIPHFQVYLEESYRVLKVGGVAVTGGDPTVASAYMSRVAEILWNMRKPIYRLFARFSNKFVLHATSDVQDTNDLAEFHRAKGFDPSEVKAKLKLVGFSKVFVFFGVEQLGGRQYRWPGWKLFVLKLLSLQNPFSLINVAEMCTISQKRDV
jgi:ubiquinone/menaquinone biosynthesis C-methylase UbiE/uncharacterized protein YbaR (Trm112 family)